MALYPVAGCKIYIGGPLDDKKTDFVVTDFEDQDWTEIDGWSLLGTLGDASQVITAALISRGRDVKMKGTANAGSMQCVFASLPNDVGQVALIAAAQPSNKNNYAFRIVLNDKPATGTGSTPSERLFIALATSAQETGGEANAVRNLESNLEVNSNIVRVAAKSGD